MTKKEILEIAKPLCEKIIRDDEIAVNFLVGFDETPEVCNCGLCCKARILIREYENS